MSVHAKPKMETKKNLLYCLRLGLDLKLQRPLAQYENALAVANAIVLASVG